MEVTSVYGTEVTTIATRQHTVNQTFKRNYSLFELSKFPIIRKSITGGQ